MSEGRQPKAPTGSSQDNNQKSGEVVKRDRRDVTLTAINTKGVVEKLNGLFDVVISGEEYDPARVRSATNITDAMIKVLKFEFDVYKHFSGRQDVAKPATTEVSIADDADPGVSRIAQFLRSTGDTIKKGSSSDDWIVNDRHCTTDDLLRRANNIRSQDGKPALKIDGKRSDAAQ